MMYFFQRGRRATARWDVQTSLLNSERGPPIGGTRLPQVTSGKSYVDDKMLQAQLHIRRRLSSILWFKSVEEVFISENGIQSKQK